MNFLKRICILLMIMGLPLMAQQELIEVTAWPIPSDLKGTVLYYSVIRSPSNVTLTANGLMAEISDAYPLPHSKLIWEGDEDYRRSKRAKVDRFDSFAVPIGTGLTAALAGGISNLWKGVIMGVGIAYPYVKNWLGLAAPPRWQAPRDLIGTSAIPMVDGEAGVTLYTYKDVGIIRRTIAVRR